MGRRTGAIQSRAQLIRGARVGDPKRFLHGGRVAIGSRRAAAHRAALRGARVCDPQQRPQGRAPRNAKTTGPVARCCAQGQAQSTSLRGQGCPRSWHPERGSATRSEPRGNRRGSACGSEHVRPACRGSQSRAPDRHLGCAPGNPELSRQTAPNPQTSARSRAAAPGRTFPRHPAAWETPLGR